MLNNNLKLVHTVIQLPICAHLAFAVCEIQKNSLSSPNNIQSQQTPLFYASVCRQQSRMGGILPRLAFWCAGGQALRAVPRLCAVPWAVVAGYG